MNVTNHLNQAYPFNPKFTDIQLANATNGIIKHLSHKSDDIVSDVKCM